nr:hypothetical protein [Citrobacter freundii]
MTTNNHPANGPVSLDRLHQISKILSKAATQSDGGNLGYAMADAVKVIDGAIASFGAEPVAWLRETAITDIREGAWTPIIQMESQRMGVNLSESWGVNYIPLYTAPPAPVVPEEKRDEDGNTTSEFDHGWNACRGAMLQAGNHSEQHLDMVDHSGDTNKNGRDGTLTNEGTIPVTQFKPVADLYGLTSPTGGETSFTFDAVEARDFIDGGWLCQEYVTLERYQETLFQGAKPVTTAYKLPFEQWLSQQTGTIDVECGCVMTEVFFHWLRVAYEAGNSPVIPDGWALVPVEPTEDMIVNGFESEPDESFSDEKEWEAYDAMSGCQQAAHRAKLCWAAMISAAPKPDAR